MKKTSNMGSIPQVSQKIPFDPWTLKITKNKQSQCINIFPIQFWYKKLFLLLFNPNWEERKKSPNSSDRERKISLTPF